VHYRNEWILIARFPVFFFFFPFCIRPQLFLSLERDKIRVVLIGHSLGAGAAAIAAMELNEHDFLEVEALGFGCPSLLSRDLSESTKEYITTVVNDADIVSRMSGASMTNMLLDLMDYDWTEDILADLEFSLQRAKESFPDYKGFLPDTTTALAWFEKRLNEVVRPNLLKRTKRNERLPSVLIPPGRCIHLFRDGYGTTGTYTPCDMFSSVEFSLTLLDDHMIATGYNRALLSAAQDSDRDYSVRSKHLMVICFLCCLVLFLFYWNL
jgi:pimeloyl-ACP methyl ester carboxylesterase